jgi:hypothetical protein
MTTVIAPVGGAGILYSHRGVGTSPGYSALDVRRAGTSVLQEGVYGTSTLVTAGGVSNVASADFMVTQRAAGANLSVDVNMPAGGFAYVQGDTVTGQGLYTVPVHLANINEAIVAADVTNPRIDQIILEAKDDILDASALNEAHTRVLVGTPTTGATLANRLGATALPGSALLLADVLVPANATTVPNSNIRDRRKWARGAFVRQLLTSGTVTTTSTSAVVISASLLATVECSGVPLRITLMATASQAVGDGVGTGCFLDGTQINGLGNLGETAVTSSSGTNAVGYVYTTIPAAGSHTIQPSFAAITGGTASLLATGTNPAELVIEELVRQNAANSNGVTTG